MGVSPMILAFIFLLISSACFLLWHCRSALLARIVPGAELDLERGASTPIALPMELYAGVRAVTAAPSAIIQALPVFAYNSSRRKHTTHAGSGSGSGAAASAAALAAAAAAVAASAAAAAAAAKRDGRGSGSRCDECDSAGGGGSPATDTACSGRDQAPRPPPPCPPCKEGAAGSASSVSAGSADSCSCSSSCAGPDGEVSCVICFAEYSHGELIKQLPCEHLFHAACIDLWLRRNGSCPLCKQPVWEPRVHALLPCWLTPPPSAAASSMGTTPRTSGSSGPEPAGRQAPSPAGRRSGGGSQPAGTGSGAASGAAVAAGAAS